MKNRQMFGQYAIQLHKAIKRQASDSKIEPTLKYLNCTLYDCLVFGACDSSGSVKFSVSSVNAALDA